MNLQLGIPKMPESRLKEGWTAEQLQRCIQDVHYFICTCVMTFDPRPGVAEPYSLLELYPYQHEYVDELVYAIETGDNLMVEKSRDMGISWVTLAVIIWFWLFREGFQALLGSYLEELVDNGAPDSLFGKFDIILRFLPFSPQGFDDKKHRTYMKLFNPMNGAIISGAAPTSRFARAGRYTAILMDEIPFWNNPDQSFASAGESSRCCILIATPPKSRNFVTALRNSGLIKVLSYHWKRHPLKDEVWYEEQISKKTPETVARELDINWEGSITGRYYPEADFMRLGDFPYHPEWPLFVSHDPGRLPDPYALIWWQVDPITARIRIIYSMERYNWDTAKFFPFFPDNSGLPNTIDSKYEYDDADLELMRITSYFKVAVHMGDHYGWNQQPTDGSSVYGTFRKGLGVYVNTNTKAIEHEPRRTALAPLLRICDVNDTPNTRILIECLKNARVPERREGHQSTSEETDKKPIHDWTSHYRSSAEYFAVNYRYEARTEVTPEETFRSSLALVQKRKRRSMIIGR